MDEQFHRRMAEGAKAFEEYDRLDNEGLSEVMTGLEAAKKAKDAAAAARKTRDDGRPSSSE